MKGILFFFTMLRVLRFYFQLALQRPSFYIIYSILLVVSAAATTLLPIFYKWLIEAIQSNKQELAITVIVIYLIALFFEKIIHTTRIFVLSHVSYYMNVNTAVSFLEKILSLDFAFHTEKSSGKMIGIYKRATGGLIQMLWHINDQMFREILSIFIALITAWIIHPLVGILLIIGLLIAPIFSWNLLQKNARLRKQVNAKEDDINAKIVDTLITFENAILFGKKKEELRRLHTLYGKFYTVERKYIWSYRFVDLSLAAGTMFLCIISISGAMYLYFQNMLKMSDLIFLIAIIFQLQQSLDNLLFQSRKFNDVITDVAPIIDLLETEPAIQEARNPISRKIQGAISFQNITFGYKKASPVLKNIDLTIRSGEKIALVGKSGQGKTTLIKLLLRLYDPNEGSVLIDDIPLSSISFATLRKNIGVVSQEPIMMNASIGDNIGYPRSCTKKEIITAAKKSNLHDFITSLPDGYNTMVGERGMKLSGGQKQRIAIARAFIHNPRILIFDEATSQLDSENEKLIQEALWNVAKDKTLILIAHRLSTIQHVDTIVVLEHGKIKEKGTHKELLSQKSSLYSYLWNLQTKHTL